MTRKIRIRLFTHLSIESKQRVGFYVKSHSYSKHSINILHEFRLRWRVGKVPKVLEWFFQNALDQVCSIVDIFSTFFIGVWRIF
jgi:hypothetical protein